jgi:hypothetical protein
VVDFDTAGLYSSGNPTRLTAPIAGIYHIIGQVQFNTAAGGYRQVSIHKNGSPRLVSVLYPGGTYLYAEASTLAKLNAGDYVEVKVVQSSGSPLSTFAGTDTGFMMTWVAPPA